MSSNFYACTGILLSLSFFISHTYPVNSHFPHAYMVKWAPARTSGKIATSDWVTIAFDKHVSAGYAHEFCKFLCTISLKDNIYGRIYLYTQEKETCIIEVDNSVTPRDFKYALDKTNRHFDFEVRNEK